VAQRDQLAGALGGLDAGEAGDFEHVALGKAAIADELKRRRQHAHQAAGPGLAE
jgi:hypothetical protein